MPDIRVVEISDMSGVTMDWLQLSTGLLDETEELATAIRVAIGTDRRAMDDDELPDMDSIDRRGWWGDTEAIPIWDGWPIGSRLWLVERAKITSRNYRQGATTARIDQYIQEALIPFIEHGICTRFDTDVQRTGVNSIEARVTIYRGPVPDIELRFQSLWEGII